LFWKGKKAAPVSYRWRLKNRRNNRLGAEQEGKTGGVSRKKKEKKREKLGNGLLG